MLPASVKKEVLLTLADMREDPFAVGIEPLKGVRRGYRVRLSVPYRILFYANESRRTVEVARIRKRSVAYKGIEPKRITNPPTSWRSEPLA
ncbi:MAG: hypothetical protein SFV18_07400 [Bryobacteraceae bacterium]|nr:hypothetical protein [Bryobacteraceae bacterium]